MHQDRNNRLPERRSSSPKRLIEAAMAMVAMVLLTFVHPETATLALFLLADIWKRLR